MKSDLENRVKELLRESNEPNNFDNVLKEFIDSEEREENKKKKEGHGKGDLKAKHDRIKGLLGNNVFNHAGVIEKLWGDSEASNRSLFRKKLNRELNDNGVPYEFDDEELSKIANILMDTSKQVSKKLGGKKG